MFRSKLYSRSVRICKTNSLGNKNGIEKLYHLNGQLCSEVNYIDGKREGIYKSYYGNGQLKSEINYIDGLA
jgi:antitoxin component YwqK of YwqJK toxin-antitoxin module